VERTYHDVEFTEFSFASQPGTDSLSLVIRGKLVKKKRRKEMSYQHYCDLGCIVTELSFRDLSRISDISSIDYRLEEFRVELPVILGGNCGRPESDVMDLMPLELRKIVEERQQPAAYPGIWERTTKVEAIDQAFVEFHSQMLTNVAKF
jgi:hypothetical protein